MFYDPLPTASTSEDFDKLKPQEDEKTFTFFSPAVNDTIHNNPQVAYQPLEYVNGFRGKAIDASQEFKTKGKIGFTRPSIFGHCSNDYLLKFMENLPSDSCVVNKKVLDSNLCQRLSFKNLSYFEIGSGDGITTVPPTLGNSLKFSLDTSKQVPLNGTDFLNSTFSGNCGCDNFVLETHYKVFFSNKTDTQPTDVANQFYITKVVVDIVYGTLADVGINCKERVFT